MSHNLEFKNDQAVIEVFPNAVSKGADDYRGKSIIIQLGQCFAALSKQEADRLACALNRELQELDKAEIKERL